MQAHFGGRWGSRISDLKFEISYLRSEISDLRFEISDFASGGFRAERRWATSIGQFLSSAHTICFTAVLQDDGLSDASSVTVKKLDLPTLNGSLAGRRPHQPAGGGGVLRGQFARRPQQQPDPPAALGGQLQPPRREPRQPL